jgi:hypothetical protein
MKDGLIFYQGPVADIVPHFSKFGLVLTVVRGPRRYQSSD